MAGFVVLLVLLAASEASNFTSTIWTEQQANSLNQLFGKLGQDIDNLKTKIDYLEAVQEQYETENKKLLKLTSVLMTENKLLKDNNAVINKTLTHLLVDSETMRQSINNLENNVGHSGKNISSVIGQDSSRSGFCGFSSTITASSSSYLENQAIIFVSNDNIGSCYSDRTGIFTAASSGPYFFSWTIRSSEAHFHSELVRNGRNIATSMVSAPQESVTSTSVILLNAGDDVWVRTTRAGHLYGNKISAFTGFTIIQ